MGQNVVEETQADTGREIGEVQVGRQRAAIYARVSTVDQSCERQPRDLAAFAERSGFEVVDTFAEIASGVKDSRRERKRVLAQAQERRIDAVLVTEFSRWGRSTQDLLATLHQLRAGVCRSSRCPG